MIFSLSRLQTWGTGVFLTLNDHSTERSLNAERTEKKQHPATVDDSIRVDFGGYLYRQFFLLYGAGAAVLRQSCF